MRIRHLIGAVLLLVIVLGGVMMRTQARQRVQPRADLDALLSDGFEVKAAQNSLYLQKGDVLYGCSAANGMCTRLPETRYSR
jgi:hypothetical protein